MVHNFSYLLLCFVLEFVLVGEGELSESPPHYKKCCNKLSTGEFVGAHTGQGEACLE